MPRVSHVRLPRVPLRRALCRALVAAYGLGLAILSGCSGANTEPADVAIELSMSPSPPVVGTSTLTLTVKDAAGQPLTGARLKAEGNMNHAGMVPSFATLKEIEPGTYAGELKFTMGGDWYVLVTGKTADGKTIERSLDVKGVQAQ